MFRLLIADDEDLVRRGLAALIQREAPEFTVVGAAADGLEALRLAEETSPDIVCTDIRMPGLSGLDLIERLRVARPGLRSIILSGYDDFAYARRAIGLGVAEYLLKPVDADQLLEILARLRAGIAAERQDERLRLEAARITAEQTVRRLLDGGAVDAAALSACLPPSRAWGLILVYPVKDQDPSQSQERERAALLSWEDALGACCRDHLPAATVVLDGYGYYCALFPLDGGECARAATAARALHAALCTAGWPALVTVARPSSGFDDLKTAYAEAIARADYYTSGANDTPLLCWELLSARPAAQAERWPALPHGRRDALLGAVTQGSEEDAARAAGEFMAYLRGRLAPGAARALWVEMVVLLINHVQERGVRVDAILDARHDPRTFLLEAVDAGELETRLVYLATQAVRAVQAVATRHAPRGTIAELRSYIDAHLDGDLTITTLARRVHLNAKYLGELFKDVTSEPLGEYIIRTRMRRACALLADSSSKVYEIAEQVGYGSPRHFATMFRATVGLSPAEYRERRRQELPAGSLAEAP